MALRTDGPGGGGGTALGVMYVLRRCGVNVPGEVAVTGFDDIPMARHVHPLMTTCRPSASRAPTRGPDEPVPVS